MQRNAKFLLPFANIWGPDGAEPLRSRGWSLVVFGSLSLLSVSLFPCFSPCIHPSVSTPRCAVCTYSLGLASPPPAPAPRPPPRLLPVCLSPCMFVCLSVCLSCLSVCLSVCLYVCMSFCLSVCLPVCRSVVCLSGWLTGWLPGCRSVRLSSCLSVGLSGCRHPDLGPGDVPLSWECGPPSLLYGNEKPLLYHPDLDERGSPIVAEAPAAGPVR
jgi:hypothetical protein